MSFLLVQRPFGRSKRIGVNAQKTATSLVEGQTPVGAHGARSVQLLAAGFGVVSAFGGKEEGGGLKCFSYRTGLRVVRGWTVRNNFPKDCIHYQVPTYIPHE